MPEKTIRLHELIRQDEPPVRVMRSYHTTIGRHDHDFYELVYVTEGFCLHEVYGEVTLLMEGDLFILPPGVAHRYIGNRVTRIFNCVFSGQAFVGSRDKLAGLPGMEQLFSAEDERIPLLHLSLNERKRCRRQLEIMLEECTERQTGWGLRLSGLLTCVLVDYARSFSSHVGADTENSVYSGYVAQALSYIDAHFAEPELTVREIAAQVGVSADYLSRQFRKALGIGAQEYLKRYRFARAMALLQADIPVGEAAREVGFSSLCHFSREFKKELGVTPSQYRNQEE
ncbi:MAG: helix-turn-helix transcriptional regulator [Clostridia bacterium]|nr:helix-turn-helix transcriptional regulator [Clostridia bacterium]